ncbi:hypothetical protein QJQ45_017004 [Haematococcus lacustris]|nr:hypothetical protein QJQ45_017004 [Haematococcus lacustris]
MVDTSLMRQILHSRAGGEDEHDEASSEGTLDIRIVALFAILVSGLFGGLPPLYLKVQSAITRHQSIFTAAAGCYPCSLARCSRDIQVFRKPGAPLPRLLRAMSAGIILALACIHIIPESTADLGRLADLLDPPYDVSGCTIVFGVILMVVLQSIAHSSMASASVAKAGSAGALPSICVSPDHAESANTGGQAHVNPKHVPVVVISATPGQNALDPHGHICARTNHMAMQAAAISSSSLRQQAMAMMFELGCIFHSFIIGLTLGVETEDRQAVIGLTVALCFHQWLEGIALGGFIINAGLSAWKGMTMIVVYSLTCPIGVAAGLKLADSYDPSSVTALAVQGVLNGVSGGMLLYVALVMIIAEDFTRQDTLDGYTYPSTFCHTHKNPHHPPSPHSGPPVVVEGLGLETSQRTPSWLYPACHVALAVGAAMMAVMAMWA